MRAIYPCNSKVLESAHDSQAYRNNNNALTCFMLCDFSLGISEVAVNAQTRQSGTLLAHGRVTAAKDGARPSTLRVNCDLWGARLSSAAVIPPCARSYSIAVRSNLLFSRIWAYSGSCSCAEGLCAGVPSLLCELACMPDIALC